MFDGESDRYHSQRQIEKSSLAFKVDFIRIEFLDNFFKMSKIRATGIIRKRHKKNSNIIECNKSFFIDLNNDSTYLSNCVRQNSSLTRISYKSIRTRIYLTIFVLCIVIELNLAKTNRVTDHWQAGSTGNNLHRTPSEHYGVGNSRKDALSFHETVESRSSKVRHRNKLVGSKKGEEQTQIQLTEQNTDSNEGGEHPLKIVPYYSSMNKAISQSNPRSSSSVWTVQRAGDSNQVGRFNQLRNNPDRSRQKTLNRSSRTAERPSSGSIAPQAQRQTRSSTESKCALILQRTYFKKVSNERVTNEDALSGNDLNSNQLMDTGKRERICITYKEVNKAIALAKQRRQFSGVAEEEIMSIEPSVPVIAELGELNQEITKILRQKFDLSPDEILNGLTLIDMSRTDFWPICPLMVRPVRCDSTGRFRSFTGHCNNLRQPAWGAAQTPFVRYLAPRHPDGIQQERASVVDGSALPSPRLVTSVVHRDHDQPSSDLSLLVMVWGQIIDHDVALAAPPRGKFMGYSWVFMRLLLVCIVA